MFQTKLVEKITTHIFYSINLLLSSFRLTDGAQKATEKNRPQSAI